MEEKICCDKPMRHFENFMDMQVTSMDLWVCMECGSYEKHEFGQMDMELAWDMCDHEKYEQDSKQKCKLCGYFILSVEDGKVIYECEDCQHKEELSEENATEILEELEDEISRLESEVTDKQITVNQIREAFDWKF